MSYKEIAVMPKNKLTKSELKQYLDAKIRERARWSFPRDDAGTGSLDTTIDLTKVGAKVLDAIVGSYDYDEQLLAATRSVNFTIGYVKAVIRRAIKVGTITLEQTRFGAALVEAFAFTVGDKKFAFKGKKKFKKKKGCK